MFSGGEKARQLKWGRSHDRASEVARLGVELMGDPAGWFVDRGQVPEASSSTVLEYVVTKRHRCIATVLTASLRVQVLCSGART